MKIDQGLNNNRIMFMSNLKKDEKQRFLTSAEWGGIEITHAL